MINVLLVEDELIVRQGMKSLISWNEHGFQLFEASHGQEALEIMREKNIDILITDIAMPVMDGLTLIKTIHEENIQCEVIILSSHDEFEYARKAMRLKVRDYIHKPTILPEELITNLKSIVSELNLHKKEENYREIIMETAEYSSKYLLEKMIKSALTGAEADEKIVQMLKGVQVVEHPVYLRLIKFVHPFKVKENHQIREITEKQFLSKLFLNKNIESHSVIMLKIEDHWLIVLSEEFNVPQEKINNDSQGKDTLTMLSVESTQPVLVTELNEVYPELTVELAEKVQEWEEKNKIQPIIQDSIDYIHSNYMDDLSLEAISKKIHVSPSYFSKLFDEQVGTNFISYLTKVRIKKAKELLRKTDLTIYDITEKVGYKNSKYFTKVFKKSEQMTPGEYRKRNKG